MCLVCPYVCDHNVIMRFCLHVMGKYVPNGFSGCCVPASIASLTPHFLEIVVDVNDMVPPDVLRLWMLLSNGMLPVKYFCFRQFSFGTQGSHEDEVYLATHSSVDITGFETVMYVCNVREMLGSFWSLKKLCNAVETGRELAYLGDKVSISNNNNNGYF